LARGLYEQAETAARNDINALRVSYGNDSLAVARAGDVLARSLILNGRGTEEETLALARHVVRTKEAHLGADDPDLGWSLLNLGEIWGAAGELERAFAAAPGAVVLYEASAGGETLDVAEALAHRGAILRAARRYDDALKALERSLRLKEAVLEGT